MNKTGTNVGYECLLDERGDNGAFANTLWEVRCVIVSLCYAYQDKKRHTVTDQ